MTDDRDEFQRRLEQATSRTAPADDAWGPETASLRAGWLALGELLEATGPQGDLPWSGMPADDPLRRKRPRAVGLMGLAALAASALIAAAIAWHASGLKTPRASPPPSAPVAGTNPQPTGTPTPRTPVAAAESHSSWDAGLDDDLERAGRAILQAEQDQLAFVTRPSQVHYQLENLKRDLENGPL